MSNSSHTLSAHSSGPPSMDSKPAAVDALLSTLSSDPHVFLQPPQDTAESVLALAKHYLDPLALGITEEQLYRQKEARKKRKRGQKDPEHEKVLGLRKVHVDGFAVDQVWEQARRVLDAARSEVEKGIPTAVEIAGSDFEDFEDQEDSEPKRVRFAEDGAEEGSEEEDDDLSAEDYDEDGSDGEDMEDMSGAEEEEGEDIEMDGEEEEEDEDEEEPVEEFKEDKFGLNDGFFSIDDFNRQSEFLEQQDARGEDDAASDEEEIDWNANPLEGGNAKLASKSRGNKDDEEEEDESDDDDEEGPTFGDMDLDAPEGASDKEDDEDDEDMDTGDAFGLTNANNIMYSDFFAPPPQKAGKGKGKKKGRPHPHNFPESGQAKLDLPQDDQDEMERTMAAVHRDLFSDSDHGDSDESLSDADPGDPKSRRSTHERRQAKLAEEIRRLEAENVAKRSWTLSGEARAADRPLNSLLEEDLDFERAGKPVPVITQEVSEDIEALIKRRILAHEFDELIRRRPNDLATGSQSRRGLFDLPDTKSSKGLGELYEEDHKRATDPNYVSEKDSKLAAAHAEISALWKDVSAKLDALSSWNYKPKPAMPTLEVRVDAPAITMEDARPTAGGEVGNGSMLAPQEVYRPGMNGDKKDSEPGEILTKGGMPVKREEMSREEKAARRRRAKEAQKKANLNAPTKIANGTNGVVNGAAKKGKDEKEVVDALKKGGVKVIGKRGELTSVDGKAAKVQGRDGKVSAGAYKL